MAPCLAFGCRKWGRMHGEAVHAAPPGDLYHVRGFEMLRQAAFVGLVALLVAGAASAEPVTLSGTVVGPDGKGVAGAEVVTMEWLPEPGGVATKVVAAAADGTFTFKVEPLPYAGQDATVPIMARKAGLAMVLEEAKPGVPMTLKLGDKPERRSGIVNDAEGKPIANAAVIEGSVYRARGDGPQLMSMHVSNLKGVADAEGRFDLEGFVPGVSVSVSIVADGYAGGRVQINNTAPVKVVLSKAAGVSGKVLVNGQPQAGLSVTGSAQTPGGPPSWDSTKTAADGTYTLSRLSAGRGRVYVTAPEGVASPLAQSVELKAGQTVTAIDFNLTPGAIIRGKVTDAKTGEPLPKTWVMAVSDEGRGVARNQADEQGKYELRVPVGTLRLQTQVDTKPGVIPFVSGDPAVAPQITVKEGDVIEGNNLTVKLPRKVRGQVLLPDGQPATGAKITAMGGIRMMQDLKVDAEGRFEMVLPEPPSASMQAYNPPLVLLVTEPERNLAAFVNQKVLPDQLTIKLQPAASIIVPVTDPEGRPLEGFGAYVSYPLGERYGWTGQSGTESDDKGMIRLSCLPVGIGLRVSPDETMRRLMVADDLGTQELSLKPGEERVLPPVVVDPKGRSLNVFVGSEDGQPVKGAQVWAPGFTEPAVTDEQGKVTLTKLPLKGKVALMAVHPTEQWYALESADPDAGVWPGLIVKPLGTATGILVSKGDGKPMAGVQVMAQPGREWWQLGFQIMQRFGFEQSMNKRGRTDEQGRWRLGGLVPGVTYQLIVFNGNAGRMAGSFVAEGGAEAQEVGTMECDPPPPAVPAGAQGVPPPPPPAW